jgi:hypothetical protein
MGQYYKSNINFYGLGFILNATAQDCGGVFVLF